MCKKLNFTSYELRTCPPAFTQVEYRPSCSVYLLSCSVCDDAGGWGGGGPSSALVMGGFPIISWPRVPQDRGISTWNWDTPRTGPLPLERTWDQWMYYGMEMGQTPPPPPHPSYAGGIWNPKNTYNLGTMAAVQCHKKCLLIALQLIALGLVIVWDTQGLYI